MQRVTRRHLFGSALVGGLAVRASPAISAAELPVPRRWRRLETPFHANPVVLPPRTQEEARQQMLWCRMLRVGDEYRIWVWTHDAPICRLFTAPDPVRGPWTEVQTTVPPPPPGWEQSHFAAADVAWDPVTRLYWASPHSQRPETEPDGRLLQLSFLLRSRDGIVWERVGDAPMVDASKHDQALNYGRFLTDGRGRLGRVGGRVWWFYRADHYVAGTVTYTLNVASTRNGRVWSPSSRNPILHGSYRGDRVSGRFGIGTALLHGGRVQLIICRQPAADRAWENVVHSSRTPNRWPERDRGRLVFRHDLLGQSDGGCLFVERGRRLLVYSALGLDTHGEPQAQGWIADQRRPRS